MNLIIDGNNLIYRAHFAHESLSGPYGPTSVLYGAMAMLADVTRHLPAGKLRLIVAWDSHRRPLWRQLVYPAYKGNRMTVDRAKTPTEKKIAVSRENAMAQVPELVKLLNDMKVEQYKINGLEADDVIAGLVHRLPNSFVLSKDSDMLQLAGNGCCILWPETGKTTFVESDLQVISLLGVRATDVPSWKALAGDASDNIKVKKGCGPQTAIKILESGLDPRYKLTSIPKKVQKDWPYIVALWPEFRKVRRIIKLYPDNRVHGLPMKELGGADAAPRLLRSDRAAAEAAFNKFCRRHRIKSIDAHWLGMR